MRLSIFYWVNNKKAPSYEYRARSYGSEVSYFLPLLGLEARPFDFLA
jgi:hypothetical protein